MKEISYIVNLRNSLKEEYRHMPILQDGAAIIIEDCNGKILVQERADRETFGLPGGCQELKERFEDTIIREVKEETNLDILEDDLELIAIVSGMSRYNVYPNGDEVYNNTVLYYTNKYRGELKINSESKSMKFKNIEELNGNNCMDYDLIKRFINMKK